MSLINDALKRVKTAQQQQPPSSSIGPQLKPVEPAPPARSVVGIVIPVAFAAVALLSLFLLWELRKQKDLTDATPVRAQANHPDTRSLETQGGSANPAAVQPSGHESVTRTSALATSPGVSTPIDSAAALRPTERDRTEPRATSESNPSSAAVQSLQSTGQVAAVTVGEGVLGTNQTGIANSITNNVGTNDVAPAKPPPLKLQGIVYDPKRPSAVINGRTVFVGDRIRQLRVVAITAETATLVDSSHTNVLSLAE